MTFKIHRVDQCPSTNDVLKEMASAGAPEGTVVVAGMQTAGRGTKGRVWQSPSGVGLYLSVLLRPTRGELSLLTLAAGLAARDAIRSSHDLDVRLRWPNDIVYGDRKLGGILCEAKFHKSRPESAVLGFGLNINQTDDDFSAEIRPSAVSLRQALGRPADLESLLRQVLDKTEVWSGRLRSGERESVVRAFEAASAFSKGTPLRVFTAEGCFDGTYDGINPRGALRIRTESGVRRFASAEVVKLV